MASLSPLVWDPSNPYPECMRITTWAEYGVICALNLAKRTDLGPVNGREIARQERLPWLSPRSRSTDNGVSAASAGPAVANAHSAKT